MARTGISRPPTTTAPRGSFRKVRYQLRGFRLHDRTKTRSSTTTAQIWMKRCSETARRVSIRPFRMRERTGLVKPRLDVDIFLGSGPGLRRDGPSVFLHSVPHDGA